MAYISSNPRRPSPADPSAGTMIKRNPSGGVIPSKPTSSSTFGKAIAAVVGAGAVGTALHAKRRGSDSRPPTTRGRKDGSGNKDNGNNGNNNNNNGKRGNRQHKDFDKLSSQFAPSDTNVGSVSLNSGIKSGVIVNPFEHSSSVNGSQLYVMCGSFFPTESFDSIFKTLVKGTIFFDIITICQRNISYKVDRDFTGESLYKYFSALSAALQLYYSVESILAYNIDNKQLNDGMKYLRSQLSADILGKHEELRNTLIGCPIPPSLMQFICYMYQNFSFTDSPGAPIFRLGFRSTLVKSSNKRLSAEYYDVISEELKSNYRIIGLLLASFSTYNHNSLLPCSSEVLFDKNWLTFWYNSDVTILNNIADKTVTHSRIIDMINQSLYYAHFCEDDVDGLFYACFSLFNSKTSRVEPGLWSPLNQASAYSGTTDARQRCSVLCYSKSINALVAPRSPEEASATGVFHTFRIDPEDENFHSSVNIHPAAKKVQLHSLSNMSQAVTASVNYLLAPDSTDRGVRYQNNYERS